MLAHAEEELTELELEGLTLDAFPMHVLSLLTDPTTLTLEELEEAIAAHSVTASASSPADLEAIRREHRERLLRELARRGQ